MMNYTKPPNWVRGRADCSVEMIFEALSQIVRRDVEEANKLESSKRRGYSFRFEASDEGTHPIFKVGNGQMGDRSQSVLFRMTDWGILIECADKQFLRAAPRWDVDSMKCRLSVEDVFHDPWEISQEALTPLFFG